jgi:hypothetical protein
MKHNKEPIKAAPYFFYISLINIQKNNLKYHLLPILHLLFHCMQILISSCDELSVLFQYRIEDGTNVGDLRQVAIHAYHFPKPV